MSQENSHPISFIDVGLYRQGAQKLIMEDDIALQRIAFLPIMQISILPAVLRRMNEINMNNFSHRPFYTVSAQFSCCPFLPDTIIKHLLDAFRQNKMLEEMIVHKVNKTPQI